MRPVKKGLTYFPFDVDFFDDDKLLFVSARFGLKGELVVVKLLCRIYRDEGYYLNWDEDTSLLFAKRVGDNCQHSFVNDVVNELLKRGFFDENIFKSFGVLTSRGIQKRYLAACETSKRKQILINPEFDLIFQNSGIKRVNSGGNPDNSGVIPEETPVNSGKSTQSKVKKSKVEKSRVEEETISGNKSETTATPPLDDESFNTLQNIFIRTLGRSIRIVEADELKPLLEIHGEKKVYELFKSAALAGFKSVKRILDETDKVTFTLKPPSWQNKASPQTCAPEVRKPLINPDIQRRYDILQKTGLKSLSEYHGEI